jgi:hypothetical protein
MRDDSRNEYAVSETGLVPPPAGSLKPGFRRAIAGYQLLVAAGLFATAGQALLGGSQGPGFLFAMIFGLLGAFATCAGILLWRDTDGGVKLSLLFQALQIPWLTSDVLSYHMSCVLSVYVGIEAPLNLTAFASLGKVDVLASINRPMDTFVLAVNLVAAFFAFHLLNEYLERFHPETPAPRADA